MADLTKRKIGTQDQELWDGSINETFTGETSTGRTVTLNKVGYNSYALHSQFGDILSRGPVVDVRAYGASASAEATTGGITSGTSTLTLADAKDFVNGQGIRVVGAGAAGADLITTISSGEGTVNIVLAGTAGTTVAGAAVTHEDTDALQDAFDEGFTNKKPVLVPGGTYYTTGGLKYYPGSFIVFASDAQLVMTATTGFVLRRAEDLTTCPPTSGNGQDINTYLFNVSIDMDSKGEWGLLVEACQHVIVEGAEVLNIPDGTFTYDDGQGDQTYNKAGLVLKGINTVHGCHYCDMRNCIAKGASGGTTGTGFLLTMLPVGAGGRANNNILHKPQVRYCDEGVWVQNANDMMIFNPNISECVTGIDDDSTRIMIFNPYMETCTTAIDQTGAKHGMIFGRGSISGCTNTWINPTTTDGRRNTWWSSGEGISIRPEPVAADFSAGSTFDYGGIIDLVNSIRGTTGVLEFWVYNNSDEPEVAVSLERITGTDGCVLDFRARGGATDPTFIKLASPGSNLANIETTWPAAAGYRQYLASAQGGAASAADLVAACLKADDDSYHWVSLAPVITKTTTGDPAYNMGEGTICINTFDNTVKIYADAGWRTMASGW